MEQRSQVTDQIITIIDEYKPCPYITNGEVDRAINDKLSGPDEVRVDLINIALFSNICKTFSISFMTH